MDDNFWINLASKDLQKAKAFFQAIGFTINDAHGQPGMVSLFLGKKKVILNLFSPETIQGFSAQQVTDTSKSNEVLFSLGADSRPEVDQLAQKVVAAGGSLYAKPGEKDGWMYGFGFVDPDGHRWNALYMDFSKLPKH